MSSTLDAILDEVREDALTLMSESSDRLVLHSVVREGAPAVMNYQMRGMVPDSRTMQRLATYLLALAASQEDARTLRRSRRKEPKGED